MEDGWMGPLELLILSAALQAAGIVVQKQRVAARAPGVSLGQVTRRLGAFFVPLFRDPWWLLGGLLGFVGALAGLQALAAVDLSVAKSLGRVETLFVILAGVVLLGERLRGGEALGVGLILLGSLLVAAHGGDATGRAASREAHLLLVAGVCGLLVLLAGARSLRGMRARPELALAASAGLLFGTGDTLTKGATEVAKASVPGGGFSVVESASMGSFAWTPEFALAVTAYLVGTVLIQAAFSVGRVSVIGPVSAIAGLLFPIAFALAVLGEDATPERLAGMGAISLGVVLIGRAPEAAPLPARA
jgi:drug/metabolite transporter (DMT)-like permease